MAIVKILSRHSPSYGSLVRYILRYIVDESKAGREPVYTNNLRSDTIEGYVAEFVENEAFRRQPRSDQVHLFHEIVSFGADENKGLITSQMIDDLAREYMRLRGETGVMLGAAHRDREHVHLHFCVSALQYRTGISFGLNKNQLLELKQSFQNYHQEHYPELTKSFPNHGGRNRSVGHAEWHRQQRARVLDDVRRCFDEANSRQQFLELLRDRNLHHYERGGTPAGIDYEGTRLRFSRILEPGELESLPSDTSQEDTALGQIQAVRQRQRELGSLTPDVGFGERER